MFPVDSLPASYYEEREAAEAAKRLALLQEQHAKAQAQATAVSSAANGQTQLRPSAACLQRPQISRPASSSVLGNIFQGFVKAASQNPPQPPSKDCGHASGSSTPAHTPPAKIMTQAELEKMMERQKDADIVNFRPW
ncbi:Hypothetical predicted protein [Lecanosticta acicola]|uniref:Uncharacterized protein n=1 Tax=Lecanosticta acicola TaxID=111012 RepID=A0AAI8Z619_9PEZI|nr:Hypothetical predicted protein [Lecanosticta acicola]